MFVFLVIVSIISLIALFAVAFSIFMKWLISNKISKLKTIKPRLIIFIDKKGKKG